ncbi:MAG: radical SAM protein [Candidatus Thorarchaeota archaeon]
MVDKRLDIKTGFTCNNNCRFCVQAHKKKFGNRPTEDIKKDLEKARKTKCKGVVFTGGEPTIRDDIIELVSYAKKLGFKGIQIQTNARMLSYKNLCRELINAGANEFSPAIHGHIADLHGYLTRSKGSFNQTVQAIKNLRALDQYIITNTVVVKPNYRYLPKLAKLLVELKVDQFQFAFTHAVGNAYKYYEQMMPWVSLASPYIKKGLQIGIDNGIKVMAEAMPFCTMEGYEKYCSEFYIPQTEIRDINSFDPAFEKTRKEQGKIKFPQCKKCKFDIVCEGPWREYPEKRGSDEFKPVPGKKIKSMKDI